MTLLYESVREIQQAPLLVHCSTVIELTDGELFCVWYEGPYETSSRTVLRYARRGSGNNAGVTASAAESAAQFGWSASETLLQIDGVPLGNPVLWRDGAGHIRLLFAMLVRESWTEGILLEMQSTDEGRTWSSPALFYGRKGFMPKTRPCVLRDGGLVVPLYHEEEFCPYMLVVGHGQSPYNGGLVGETMARGRVIQPAIQELSDGSILLLARSRTGWLAKSISHNKGNSWAICSDTGIPNPNSAVDLVLARQSSRNEGDTLYLIGNIHHQSRSNLSVLISHDGGKTWTGQIPIAEGRGEYSYPSAIESSDGSLWVTYTEDRYRIRAARISAEQLADEAHAADFSSEPGRSA
ncbi:MAG: exo-alpha-sialidase [Spirochaetota bacterium]